MKNSAPWVYTPEGKRVLILPKIRSDEDVVTHLLGERGVEEEDRKRFLHPSLNNLTPWSDWPSMQKGVEALLAAVHAGKPIHIHADYDVDGISSCVMLRAVLEALRVKVTFSLPNRFKEGYGIHVRHIEEALDNGAKVLVTLDNGSTAGEVMKRALEAGLEVYIFDHHRTTELPEGLHLCNPTVEAPQGCREMATAGIVLKLCEGLVEKGDLRVARESLLRMACLGTLCDQVPLTGDSRIMAALGLQALEKPTNPFLKRLFRRCRIDGVPTATDITFRVGPRLNAAGRMGDASKVVDYFFLKDPKRVVDAVNRLEEDNTTRRSLQERVVAEVLERSKEAGRTIVAWDADWHFGVLGIAAARVAQERGKVTILLTRVNGTFRGSGRSIPGLDLYAFLRPLSPLMESFGGHAMAVGLAIREENLEAFSREVESRSSDACPTDPGSVRVDLSLPLDDLTPGFLRILDAFAPHGSGNAALTFYSPNVTALSPPQPMGKNHFRMTFTGTELSFPAVFWNGGSCPSIPKKCGIIFTVETYRGARRLNLKGYHPS